MSKTRKIISTVFYAWLAASSLFCFLLDLIMSTYLPEANQPLNIDESFINQITYLSVWLTITVCVWSVLNLLAIYIKGVSPWVSGKNNQTFLTAMVFTMFIVYLATLIVGKITGGSGVAGFDNWYKILKSSIEHFLNPALILVFYFVLAEQPVKTSKYAKTTAWYILIYITAYLIVMVARDAMLQDRYANPDFVPGISGNNISTAFPYAEVDPFTAAWYIWVPAFIGIEFAPYGFEVLFNYLSNLSYASMHRKYAQL